MTLTGALATASHLARPVTGALGAAVQATRGAPGLLARRNATRDPRRSAATSAALAIGVAVAVFFAVLGASLKTSIDTSLQQTLHADLVIEPVADGAALDPALAATLARLPGISASAGVGTGGLTLNGKSQQVKPSLHRTPGGPATAAREVPCCWRNSASAGPILPAGDIRGRPDSSR
jgi:putative ABC transport system permease protein